MSRRGGRKQKEVSTSGAAHDEEEDTTQPMSIDAQLIPDSIHPWLKFSRKLTNYNTYCQKYNFLNPKVIDLPRVVDWSPLEQAGLADEIKALLVQRYHVHRQTVEYEEWLNIFQLKDPVYKELCVEFHCTFTMNEKVVTADDQTFMTFRLGGKPRKLSMKEFAGCLGIYSREQLDADHFDDYLESCEMMDIDFYPKDVWHEFSSKGFVSGGNTYKDLTNIYYRVIHRCLAYTINHRKEGCEKVSQYDLWYLRQFEAKKNINFPFSIAWYLAHNASGVRENSPICGGHFITRIAKTLKISFENLTRVSSQQKVVGAVHFVGAEAIMEDPQRPHSYLPYDATLVHAPARPSKRRHRPQSQQQHPQQEEEAAYDQFASGSGAAPQSQAQPSWVDGIFGRFDALSLQQEQTQQQQTYEFGAQRYHNAWSAHNTRRLYEGIPNQQPTPYHYPPMWQPSPAVNPQIPVYEEAVALAELQEQYRRQQERDQQERGFPYDYSPF